jgi:hypothetical protein
MEGLRIRFDVHQGDTSTPNYANILITNLTDASSQVAFFENKAVTLSAGYADSAEIIFQGQIRQARNLRENTTDKLLHILATDAGQARNFARVNKTLPAGHTFKDRAQVAFDSLKQMGVKIGYVAPLQPNVKFPRGFAAFGMAKDLLREICMATNTSWSIQNGTLQVVANDQPKPGNVIVLNSRTGLVGLPVQTIQGIEGLCLLNPRITPGCLVQIDQKSIQQAAISPGYLSETNNMLLQQVGIAADGIYKIFVAEHKGDARGNEFYTSFIGVRRGDPITKALAARGITDGSPPVN